ncbi:MAG TPA: hypothetical protein VER14_03180 [Phototrophicaceae bacterium]|nr:hypothetical protein [Phototrophicaceae bacterium]
MEEKRIRKGNDIYKIEPYLTSLNIHQLKSQDADVLSKVTELEEVNQSIRKRITRKDDPIAMLSDQIVTITERLRTGK